MQLALCLVLASTKIIPFQAQEFWVSRSVQNRKCRLYYHFVICCVQERRSISRTLNATCGDGHGLSTAQNLEWENKENGMLFRILSALAAFTFLGHHVLTGIQWSGFSCAAWVAHSSQPQVTTLCKWVQCILSVCDDVQVWWHHQVMLYTDKELLLVEIRPAPFYNLLHLLWSSGWVVCLKGHSYKRQLFLKLPRYYLRIITFLQRGWILDLSNKFMLFETIISYSKPGSSEIH